MSEPNDDFEDHNSDDHDDISVDDLDDAEEQTADEDTVQWETKIPDTSAADDESGTLEAEKETDETEVEGNSGTVTETLESVGSAEGDDAGGPVEEPPSGEPATIGVDDELYEEYRNNPIQFEQPNISQERFPTLKARKQLKKRQKLLNKGYIEWYLFDDSWPRAMYIQPTNRDGIPQYEHNGNTYLFPKSGAVPNRVTGMWTFVHRKGYSDPLNLRSADDHAIPADVLHEFLSMSVSSSPPSFFDKWDVDGQTLLYGSIAVVLVLGAVWQFMGGM